MKTHKMAFLPGLAAAVILLLAAGAFGTPKPEDSRRPWTILLYGAVDNRADDPFVEFTDQLRRAIDDDPGIELILFIDRSDKHRKSATFLGEDFTSTRLYRIRKNSVERLSGGTYLEELDLSDSPNIERHN